MITIKVSYEEDFGLVLSDKGHTNVKGSKDIRWKPDKRTVLAVTDISMKRDSPMKTSDFWSEKPNQDGDDFKGTTSGAIGAWDYFISAKAVTSTGERIIPRDPRIQVEADLDPGQ